MPNLAHGLASADIDRQIQLLIRNLVEIKDTSGEFLLRLEDGRVIDTKGWNDWEWTHGVGLYGIWKYYQQTRDARCRQIMLDWFRDRFAAGTPTKNINTVAPFLTLAYLYEEISTRVEIGLRPQPEAVRALLDLAALDLPQAKKLTEKDHWDLSLLDEIHSVK